MNTLDRSLFSPNHEALDTLLAPMVARIDPRVADREIALIVERLTFLTTCGLSRKGRAEILARFASASFAGLLEDVLAESPRDGEVHWSKLSRVFRVSPPIARHLHEDLFGISTISEADLP